MSAQNQIFSCMQESLAVMHQHNIKSGVVDMLERLLTCYQDKSFMVCWHVDDVKSIRPDLDEEECAQVLAAVEHSHDCNVGVNWDNIFHHANSLYPVE